MYGIAGDKWWFLVPKYSVRVLYAYHSQVNWAHSILA